MSDPKRSWEMMEDESSRAYEAFCIYYQFDPKLRSMKRVAEELGHPDSYVKWLEQWSSKYSWVQRARDYDSHVARSNHERERKVAEERAKARLEAIEEARSIFTNRASELAYTLIEHTVNPDATGANVRATVEALNRAGVTVPQEVQLRVSDLAKKPDTDHLKEMSDDELSRRIRAKVGTP